MSTPPKMTTLARNLRQQDTWAEKLLWRWLQDKRFSGYKFRRQHPFGPHILDFFCVEATLNIELDGSQHGRPEHKRIDEARDAWLAQAGVKVLRFWNSYLRREQQSVRDTIWHELQARAAHPLPDYCRPMTSELSTLPSPSPQPSPLGRGGHAPSLTRYPADGFSESATGFSEDADSHSLSPRERARVRGNKPSYSTK